MSFVLHQKQPTLIKYSSFSFRFISISVIYQEYFVIKEKKKALCPKNEQPAHAKQH